MNHVITAFPLTFHNFNPVQSSFWAKNQVSRKFEDNRSEKNFQIFFICDPDLYRQNEVKRDSITFPSHPPSFLHSLPPSQYLAFIYHFKSFCITRNHFDSLRNHLRNHYAIISASKISAHWGHFAITFESPPSLRHHFCDHFARTSWTN